MKKAFKLDEIDEVLERVVEFTADAEPDCEIIR